MQTFLEFLAEAEDENQLPRDPNAPTKTPEQKAQDVKKAAKERAEKREREKLMPNEYDNSDDAKKAAERMGVQGFHTISAGKYKPGNSEDALRDALAKRKEASNQKSGKPTMEDVGDNDGDTGQRDPMFPNFADELTDVQEAAAPVAIHPSDIHIPGGNLNIARNEMPQIKSTDVPAFLDFIRANHVHVSREKVPARSLKPIQKEINRQKVMELMTTAVDHLAKPVIITDDNYILDGHHRWLALLNLDPSYHMDAYRVHCKVLDLLRLARLFPKTSYKTVNESRLLTFLEWSNLNAH